MKGFTLLEILISLMLLSIICLTLDATQISSLRITRSNFYRNIAQNQLQNLALQLNVPNANNNVNTILDRWKSETHSVLPQAKTTIKVSSSTIKVSILWDQYGCITEQMTVRA